VPRATCHKPRAVGDEVSNHGLQPPSSCVLYATRPFIAPVTLTTWFPLVVLRNRFFSYASPLPRYLSFDPCNVLLSILLDGRFSPCHSDTKAGSSRIAPQPGPAAKASTQLMGEWRASWGQLLIYQSRGLVVSAEYSRSGATGCGTLQSIWTTAGRGALPKSRYWISEAPSPNAES
jgi:hypothetical protein